MTSRFTLPMNLNSNHVTLVVSGPCHFKKQKENQDGKDWQMSEFIGTFPMFLDL